MPYHFSSVNIFQRYSLNYKRRHRVMLFVLFANIFIHSGLTAQCYHPPPSSWSTFNQSVRTNKNVEGWHRHLNYQAANGNSPFYVLVLLLNRESRLVKLQSKLVKDGKLSQNQCKAANSTRVYYLNYGTSLETATYQSFLRHVGKYSLLLSRPSSTLRLMCWISLMQSDILWYYK